jgi:hypothetical protein
MSLFKLNENEDKAAVAREKIMEHHFGTGDEAVKIQVFDQMPRATFPFSLEWIGRGNNRCGFSLLYNVVKEFPILFDICISKGGPQGCAL